MYLLAFQKNQLVPKKFEPLFKNDFLGSSFSFESNKRLVPQLDFCVGFNKRVLAWVCVTIMEFWISTFNIANQIVWQHQYKLY